MNKNIVLGINKNECCILKTLASFHKIEVEKNFLEESDFEHSSTNWSGKDDTARTVELNEYHLTGKRVILDKPLIFKGKNPDHGKEYDWKFEVLELWEVSSYFSDL